MDLWTLTAHSAVIVLAGLASYLCRRALRVPWLLLDTVTIGLERRCTQEGNCELFPSQMYCYNHADFCNRWRSSSFAVAVAMLLLLLVLLATCFSLPFQHRSKTRNCIRGILSVAILLQVAVLVCVPRIVHHADYFANGKWQWASGYNTLLVATIVQVLLLASMSIIHWVITRKHVAGGLASEEGDEDDESYLVIDVDSVSLDENIPEDQIDYYLFTKQARRHALRSLG